MELANDAEFRSFHEGRSEVLPAFYDWALERRLGPYASLLSRSERTPIFKQPTEPILEETVAI